MLPQLDEQVRTALNGLQIDSAECKPYHHEILIYGVDALTHVYLMKKAQEVVRGETSLEDFSRRYELDFTQESQGFTGSLLVMEKEGLFVPQQASGLRLKLREGKVWFFNHDYGCRFRGEKILARYYGIPAEDSSYTEELMERKWELADLSDADIVERGLKFGKHLWSISLKTYEQTLKGFGKSRESVPKQPEEVTRLVQKLIEYYGGIILS